MYASFFDCDSAQYFAGSNFMAWNYWDLNKKEIELSRYSDGTRFVDSSFKNYLMSKLIKEKNEND